MRTKNDGRRKFGWLLLAATLFMASGCGNEGSSGLTGGPAPAFTITMLDKSTISLGELKGRPVLLEFWAPWCSGCLKNIPPLKKIHAVYGDRILILAASSEQGGNTVKKFVAEWEIPYLIGLSTQKLLTDYKVSGIPRTILIDAKGMVRFSHVGQVTVEMLEEKINDVLSGQ